MQQGITGFVLHTVRGKAYHAKTRRKHRSLFDHWSILDMFGALQGKHFLSHTIHVWYICLHLVDFYGFHVGKHTVHGWYGFHKVVVYLKIT